MKRILILTFLLPAICLGQVGDGITTTFDSAGNVRITFDGTKICKGSIGYTLPPTLVGEHLPNCLHRQYCEREARANAARDWNPAWGPLTFGPATTAKTTPANGDAWSIGDTLFRVNRNGEIEKYVRLKDSCEHIWVEEYDTAYYSPFGENSATVVCVRCFRQEKRFRPSVVH